MENNAIDERVQIKRYYNEKLTKKKDERGKKKENYIIIARISIFSEIYFS